LPVDKAARAHHYRGFIFGEPDATKTPILSGWLPDSCHSKGQQTARPVISEAREGVHSASTLKFRSCSPSRAMLSIRGEGASQASVTSSKEGGDFIESFSGIRGQVAKPEGSMSCKVI
jgi:hypothetical protein